MKKQNIIKQNGQYFLFNEIEIREKLEVGNYRFDYNNGGMYLIDVPDLKMPEKIYDIDIKFRQTVKHVFNRLNKNVGVLLTGYKGTGKSLLSKQICIDSELPVVMITAPIDRGVDFVGFLNGIKQDIVIFIDEFEKIFHRNKDGEVDKADYHSQSSFLTMMDGALSNGNKKLFILTTNSEVDDHFINRPSRIRYYKKYQWIQEELYDMIIQDKLENKENEQDLRDNLPLIECSVDILNTIIEEMNITNSKYSDFKSSFNHKPPTFSYVREKYVDGEFKYDDHVELDRELDRNNIKSTISYNAKLISVSNEYIVYSDRVHQPVLNADGTENDDIYGKDINVTYRLKKSTGYTNKSHLLTT